MKRSSPLTELALLPTLSALDGACSGRCLTNLQSRDPRRSASLRRKAPRAAQSQLSGYLAAYADVQAAGVNPLDHYNQFGWKEGRDPWLGFDTSSYLAANPDVAAANINPLSHFLDFGRHEGRSPFADGSFSEFAGAPCLRPRAASHERVGGRYAELSAGRKVCRVRACSGAAEARYDFIASFSISTSMAVRVSYQAREYAKGWDSAALRTRVRMLAISFSWLPAGVAARNLPCSSRFDCRRLPKLGRPGEDMVLQYRSRSRNREQP